MKSKQKYEAKQITNKEDSLEIEIYGEDSIHADDSLDIVLDQDELSLEIEFEPEIEIELDFGKGPQKLIENDRQVDKNSQKMPKITPQTRVQKLQDIQITLDSPVKSVISVQKQENLQLQEQKQQRQNEKLKQNQQETPKPKQIDIQLPLQNSKNAVSTQFEIDKTQKQVLKFADDAPKRTKSVDIKRKSKPENVIAPKVEAPPLSPTLKPITTEIPQQTLNEWKNKFRQQVGANLLRDLDMQKMVDENFKKQAITNLLQLNIQELIVGEDTVKMGLKYIAIIGKVGAEKLFAFLISNYLVCELMQIVQKYKQFFPIVGQAYAKLKADLVKQITFSDVNPDTVKAFALFYQQDFSHQLMQDADFVQMLERLQILYCKQPDAKLALALSLLLQLNKNQLFYKFKMYRRHAADPAVVEQFDFASAKLFNAIKDDDDSSAQQIRQVLNEYREYFVAHSGERYERPALLPPAPVVKPLFFVQPDDEFERFREGVRSLDVFEKMTACDVLEKFITTHCLRLYASCIDRLRLNTQQLGQVARRLCTHCQCDEALANSVEKYCSNAQTMEMFVSQLAKYQHCMSAVYAKQAFSEAVFGDMAANSGLQSDVIQRAQCKKLTYNEKKVVNEKLWGRGIKLEELE